MSNDIDWPVQLGSLLLPRSLPGAFRRILLGRRSAPWMASAGPGRPCRVSADELDRRLRDASALLDAARPHLEWISTHLSGEDVVVYFVDRDAVVLWSAGARPGLLEEASVSPGYEWSERSLGTNAAGTAVAGDEPVLALGEDQGEPGWRRHTAMAVPLHAPDGEVLGAVVVSGSSRAHRTDRLALAAYAAFAIECRLGDVEGPLAASAHLPSGRRMSQDEGSRYRRILDSAPDPTLVFDESGTILYTSQECGRVLGYSMHELLGQSVGMIIPGGLPEPRGGHRRRMSADLRTVPLEASVEACARRRDGSHITVEIRLSPVLMREGRFFAASFRDVTARKEELRRLRVQYSVSRVLAEEPDLAAAIPRALQSVLEELGWDCGGLWLREGGEPRLRESGFSASGAFAASPSDPDELERSREVGRRFASRVWENAGPVLEPSLDGEPNLPGSPFPPATRLRAGYGIPLMQGGQAIGVVAFFSLGAMDLDADTHRLLSSVANHVSRSIERSRAAALVRERESRLEQLLHQLPAAVWTVNTQLAVDLCAGRFCRWDGLIPAEAHRGRPLVEAIPSDPVALEVHQQALDGKPGSFDLERGELSLAGQVEPLRNGAGEIVGALGVAVDVTGLRRAQDESRRLTAQLKQLVRDRTGELHAALRETDALSYSIAHDLRAPLRAIASGAQIILEEHGRLGEEGRGWAARILEAANRMDTLVLGLLEYSRFARQDLKIQAVDLEEVVKGVLSEMKSSIMESKARVAVDRPLPAVMGDPLALMQALGNLLSNALKFVAPGVEPAVRIYAAPGEGGKSIGGAGAGFVRLGVQDNGIGLDLKHRDRIFGVFERLHARERYPGTGIGLAITKRIVERMGGRVGLDSELGQGSNFYVDLPGA